MSKRKKNALPRVTRVLTLPDYHLWVSFNDGRNRVLNLQPLLDYPAFRALKDESVFERAEIDPVSHTVCWPDEVCLDIEILRGTHVPAPLSPSGLIEELVQDLARLEKRFKERAAGESRRRRRRTPRKAAKRIHGGGWHGKESLKDLLQQVKD